MNFKLNLLNIYTARIIARYLYPDADVVFRQQASDLFGPLNKTIRARIKILFIPQIQSFRLIFKAVKIKMIYFIAVADIFVYDGEGWACYNFGSAQAFT